MHVAAEYYEINGWPWRLKLWDKHHLRDMRWYPDVCKLGWNFKSYVSLCVNKYCNGAENNTCTCFDEVFSCCCCCLPLLPHLACNNLTTMILQLFSLKLRADLAVCHVHLVRFLAQILSLPLSLLDATSETAILKNPNFSRSPFLLWQDFCWLAQ